MTWISAKFKNFKLHKDLELHPNGESCFLVADTGSGKSIVMDALAASLGLQQLDLDFLSDGAESASLEIVHELDGMQYTIERKHKRGQKVGRWIVTDQNGGDHKLEKLLKKIFGAAFTNSYFDHKKYFYELKSSKDRFDYVVKALGGNPVLDNIRTIKTKTEERNTVGGERKTYLTLVSRNTILDPDTLDEDRIKYEKEKTFEEAHQDEFYVTLRDLLKDKEKIQIEYDEVKQFNDEFKAKTDRNPEIDLEIIELQNKLAALKKEKKDNLKWLKDNPNDLDLEKELADQLAKADEFNKEHLPKVEQAFKDAVESITEFNRNKNMFDTGYAHAIELKRLNKQWNDLADDIVRLRAENKSLIQKSAPEIGLVVDEDNEKVFYNDRELCFPNVSKGQAIRITADIQRSLNPKGFNMILVPEGMAAGSELDEIIEVCNSFGVQYIIEITKRKQKFQLKFEEEFLKELDGK